MEENNTPYEKQIFVCTHVDEQGKHCGNGGRGEDIFRALRGIAKERKLHPKIRVAQAKCLGQCAHGPNVMAYPDNKWYKHVNDEDIKTIADKYITE